MSEVKPHYQGHRLRLRERLKADATSMADYEILELILGLAQARRDTKPLAKELLRRFKTIRGVLDAHPEELLEVEGFSSGTLALWGLLRETMARYAESPVRLRERLSSPDEVAAMARMRLGGCPHEEVWAALVDAGNQLLCWLRLDRGTANGSVVHIRRLMEQVLEHKASGIILVHNHPGGTLSPSNADIEMTRRLREAATTLGIRLHDHFILTDTAYFSFKTDGLL